MKTRAFILAFLFCIGLTFAQAEEFTYQEYSYSELFEMIEAETDSVFKLKDAVIRLNKQTDSAYVIPAPRGGLYFDSIVNDVNRRRIDKEIQLVNVHFEEGRIEINGKPFAPSLKDLVFSKPVSFNRLTGIRVFNCVFKDEFVLRTEIEEQEDSFVYWQFVGSEFHNRSRFIIDSGNPNPTLLINECKFFFPETITQAARFKLHGMGVWFINNHLYGNSQFRFHTWDNPVVRLLNNNVSDGITWITIGELINNELLEVMDNQFGNYVWFSSSRNWAPKDYLDWTQFEGKLINWEGIKLYQHDNLMMRKAFLDRYNDSLKFVNKATNHYEIALRSELYQHYRSISEFDWANSVYVELKDLETGRLKYLYSQNPSFDNYFKFKINQFLKVFSDYGTKPAKAIIYSIYVIFIFALFYMFFPNSWDTQGRKRLVDRYTFFFKYLRKEAGIHEVYLENKQEDLMQYEEFKNLIKESGQKVPKFFTATGLPIYKWAVSGTNLSASFLRRFDIIKGRWEDLPKSKRIWKSILITGAFILAIIYDLFIKALNALMLSVNAFTTLGFGEIPIKGVPRYLAIIQGFVGWFMLTIFSVALISQLLN